MTYNNMLRSRDIQRILSCKKITLPTKRHAVSIVSKTRQHPADQKPTLAALATDGTANSADQPATNSFTQQPPFSSSQMVSQPVFPVGLSAFSPPRPLQRQLLLLLPLPRQLQARGQLCLLHGNSCLFRRQLQALDS